MGALFRRASVLLPNANRLCYSSVPCTSCVHRCKLLVIGGGTGGCSVAWRFSRRLKNREIIIIEPSEYHYYQPLFTLVAAGIKKPGQARAPFLSVLPPKACWFKDYCETIEPAHNYVRTRCGDVICYEYLVIAVGLENNYDMIPGLRKALDDPKSGVTTIYSPHYCCKTWSLIQACCGGHAVFTYPSMGGKCAGAAQKIMYLADDYWRKRKTRKCASISYFTGSDALFGVPKYSKSLNAIAADRCIAVNVKSELVEIKPCTAVFHLTGCKEGQCISVPYNLLHVTPPMSPPDIVRCSCLADEAGYLDVDRHTLQHKQFPNIYGLGDCTCTPNAKTAAAVAPQSHVVEQNLWATMSGSEPRAQYDGYGSCPMLTSYRRGILAEFKYDKKVCESFPFDQSKERRLFYLLKTHYLPHLYWSKVIKGKWNGPKRFRQMCNPTAR